MMIQMNTNEYKWYHEGGEGIKCFSFVSGCMVHTPAPANHSWKLIGSHGDVKGIIGVDRVNMTNESPGVALW